MIIENLHLFLFCGEGALLGVVFFGGLWWTIQKSFSSDNPSLLFFISLCLRIGIVLFGLYFITDGQLSRLLVCLLGFGIARFFVIRLTTVLPVALPTPQRKVNHASES